MCANIATSSGYQNFCHDGKGKDCKQVTPSNRNLLQAVFALLLLQTFCNFPFRFISSVIALFVWR
jgi:hypothetical protein